MSRASLAGLLLRAWGALFKLPLMKNHARADTLIRLGRPIVGRLGLLDVSADMSVTVFGTSFRMHGPARQLSTYRKACGEEGAYEIGAVRHMTELLEHCSRPRVADIGAHHGWYSLYLGKLLEGRGTVAAIEPSAEIVSILRRNLEINGLHNVVVYPLAVSDRRELVRMTFSDAAKHDRRRMASAEGKVAQNGQMAITFDELNQRERLHPNLVKIDVHGVWRKVVDGMSRSLKEDVDYLYLELDVPQEDISQLRDDIRHVVEVLQAAGMEVYELRDFRRRTGGQLIDVNIDDMASRPALNAMLYARKPKS
jgi:FkbM family methyltransferase